MRYLFIVCFLLCCLCSVAQKSAFPYQLNKSDYFILPFGLGTKAFAWSIENNPSQLSYTTLQSLNRNCINVFDKSATNNWNTGLDELSEIGKYGLLASPISVLFSLAKNNQWNNSFTYGVMYFEVALVTVGFTDLSKAIIQRKRPYLYNPSLSNIEKQKLISSEGGQDSFFSGTTSISFASAVFLSKTVTDIYGKGILSKIVWTSSLTLASTVAYLRYESGQHFPTDIIAGAAVGSAIGYFIPVLHKKNSKLKNTTLIVLPNSATLAYRF